VPRWSRCRCLVLVGALLMLPYSVSAQSPASSETPASRFRASCKRAEAVASMFTSVQPRNRTAVNVEAYAMLDVFSSMLMNECTMVRELLSVRELINPGGYPDSSPGAFVFINAMNRQHAERFDGLDLILKSLSFKALPRSDARTADSLRVLVRAMADTIRAIPIFPPVVTRTP
jgi:hypothetical protein